MSWIRKCFHFFKLADNQDGIAMTQVMIGALIVGAATGLVVQNSDFLTKNITSAYFSEEIQIKKSIVENLLIDQEFCSSTLGGVDISSPVDITSIGGGEKSDGSLFPMAIQVGEKFGFNDSFEVSSLRLERISDHVTELKIGAKLKSIIVTDPETGETSEKRLVFSFGASSVEKSIKLFTETDEDIINTCFFDPSAETSGDYTGDITFALMKLCRSMDSFSQNPGDANSLANPTYAGTYFDNIKKKCITRGFTKAPSGGLTSSNTCPVGSVASGLYVSSVVSSEVLLRCAPNVYNLRDVSCSDLSSNKVLNVDGELSTQLPDVAGQSSSNYFVRGFHTDGRVICGKIRYGEIENLMDLDGTIEADNCNQGDMQFVSLGDDKLHVECTGSISAPPPVETPIDCAWTCSAWEDGTCDNDVQSQTRNCTITTQAAYGGISCADNQEPLEQEVPGTCAEPPPYVCDPGAELANNYNEYGNGISSPYEIGRAVQLLQLANSGSIDWDKNFVLCNNLDLSGVSPTYTGIGSDATPFTGSFNGNSRFISNYTSTHGLFRRIGANANIFNFEIRNSTVNCANNVCALLVDQVFATQPRIVDISIDENSQINSAGYNYIGFIIGSGNAQTITISDIINRGSINGDTSSYVGGVAGFLSGGVLGSNLNSFGGAVTLNGPGQIAQVGGVFGNISINRASSFLNFQNSSELNLHSNSSSIQVGGVIGNLYISNGAGEVSVNTLRNMADISLTGSGSKFNTGGVIGQINGGNASSFFRIFNSSSDNHTITSNGAVSTSYTGGFVGSVADYTQISGSTSAMHINNANGFGSYSGGFAGFVGGNSEISTSSSSGNLISYDNTGGFVGYQSEAGRINTSTSLGNVNCSQGNCGGFVSQMFNTSTIQSSEASGDVSCIDDNCAGFTAQMNEFSNVNNSIARGNITSTGSYVGGFSSRMFENSTITNSRSIGNIINATDYVGGFVSSVENTVEISDSSSEGNIMSANDFVGGFGGVIWGSDGNITFTDVKSIGSQVNGNDYVSAFQAYIYNQDGNYDVNFERTYTKVNTVNSSYFSGGLISYVFLGSGSDLMIDSSFVDVETFNSSREVGGLIGSIYPGPTSSGENRVNITRSLVSDTNFNVSNPRKFGGFIGRVLASNNEDFKLNVDDSYTRGIFSVQGSSASMELAGGMVGHYDSAGVAVFQNSYAAVPELLGGSTNALGGGFIGSLFYEFGAGDGPGGINSMEIINSFAASSLAGFQGGADYLVADASPDLNLSAVFFSHWLDCVNAPCDGSHGGESIAQTSFTDKTEAPLNSWDFASTWTERVENYPRLQCKSGSSANFCTDYEIAQEIPLALNPPGLVCTDWTQITSGTINNATQNLSSPGELNAYYRLKITKRPRAGTCQNDVNGVVQVQGPITKLCGIKEGLPVGASETYNLNFVDEENFNCNYAAQNSSLNFELPTGYSTACEWDSSGTTYTVERKYCSTDAGTCNSFGPWAEISNGSLNSDSDDFTNTGSSNSKFRITVTKVPKAGTCQTMSGGVLVTQGPIVKSCGSLQGYLVSSAQNYSLNYLDDDDVACNYAGNAQTAEFTLPSGYDVPCEWDTAATTYNVERQACTTGSGGVCSNYGPWTEVATGSMNSSSDNHTNNGAIDTKFRIRVTKKPRVGTCETNNNGVVSSQGPITKLCGIKEGRDVGITENYDLTFVDEENFNCSFGALNSSVEFDLPTGYAIPCAWDSSGTTYAIESKSCLD